METMGLTIEQAVAALKVPGGKRQKYGFAGTKETLIPGVGFGSSGSGPSNPPKLSKENVKFTTISILKNTNSSSANTGGTSR